MSIYWQELRFYRRSVLIWITTLCVITLTFLSVYPSMATQIDTFREVISRYPQALLTVINFRFEIFFSIYGFLSYLMTFIWIAGAIQAMNLGLNALGKETSGKTADFLLSKPVSRNNILSQKLLAIFSIIVITNLAFTTIIVTSSRFISPSTFNFKLNVLIALTLFFVQTFFLVVGFLLGAILPKVKTAVSISLPVVFGFFILSSFSAILDKPSAYYFSPFKYFDALYIFHNGHYDYKYLWTLLGLVVFCMAVSYFFYNRKDIRQ